MNCFWDLDFCYFFNMLAAGEETSNFQSGSYFFSSQMGPTSLCRLVDKRKWALLNRALGPSTYQIFTSADPNHVGNYSPLQIFDYDEYKCKTASPYTIDWLNFGGGYCDFTWNGVTRVLLLAETRLHQIALFLEEACNFGYHDSCISAIIIQMHLIIRAGVV